MLAKNKKHFGILILNLPDFCLRCLYECNFSKAVINHSFQSDKCHLFRISRADDRLCSAVTNFTASVHSCCQKSAGGNIKSGDPDPNVTTVVSTMTETMRGWCHIKLDTKKHPVRARCMVFSRTCCMAVSRSSTLVQTETTDVNPSSGLTSKLVQM